MDRADAALLAAVEAYNKPDSRYREEAFSILMLNAWELLLKAKVLADNANRVQSLYEYERRRTATGAWSTKTYVKRNRSGNIYTISLGTAITKLEQTGVMTQALRTNIDALTDIRDSASHFIVTGPTLAKQVLEIGTASVVNFIEAARVWFQHDFSRYNLYLMPIGLVSVPAAAGVLAAGDEARLIQHLAALVSHQMDDEDQAFHVSLEVNIAMRRSSTSSLGVTLSDNLTRSRSS